jgi:hypothetical protein
MWIRHRVHGAHQAGDHGDVGYKCEEHGVDHAYDGEDEARDIVMRAANGMRQDSVEARQTAVIIRCRSNFRK